MILFLDNKNQTELSAEVSLYQERLSHNQIIAFNKLDQVISFLKTLEQEKYSLIVLVADCSFLCPQGDYSKEVLSVRELFNGFIITRIKEQSCGKRLLNDKIVDDYYLEDEDKEKEIRRLTKALEIGRLKCRIRKNLKEIKGSVASVLERCGV